MPYGSSPHRFSGANAKSSRSWNRTFGVGRIRQYPPTKRQLLTATKVLRAALVRSRTPQVSRQSRGSAKFRKHTGYVNMTKLRRIRRRNKASNPNRGRPRTYKGVRVNYTR